MFNCAVVIDYRHLHVVNFAVIVGDTIIVIFENINTVNFLHIIFFNRFVALRNLNIVKNTVAVVLYDYLLEIECIAHGNLYIFKNAVVVVFYDYLRCNLIFSGISYNIEHQNDDLIVVRNCIHISVPSHAIIDPVVPCIHQRYDVT